MGIYLILLSLLFLLSIFHLNKESTFFNPTWYVILIFLILFIGFRDGIGGDWVRYENIFESSNIMDGIICDLTGGHSWK